MKNEITINIEKLLKVDDNSITDCETIRQIGLLGCIKNDISNKDINSLNRKVKKEFMFCGLYPTIINKINL